MKMARRFSVGEYFTILGNPLDKARKICDSHIQSTLVGINISRRMPLFSEIHRTIGSIIIFSGKSYSFEAAWKLL
jgi:hypothetical protein